MNKILTLVMALVLVFACVSGAMAADDPRVDALKGTDFVDWVVKPTCTTEGIYICNEATKETKNVGALPGGHEYEDKVIETVASTCTEIGYTKIQEVCKWDGSVGETKIVYVEDGTIECEAIQKVGTLTKAVYTAEDADLLKNFNVVKFADCDSPAKVYAVCKMCGKNMTKEPKEVGTITLEGGVQSEDNDPTKQPEGYDKVDVQKGHNARYYIVTVDKAATCTEDGVAHQLCPTCGFQNKDVVVKALGHKFDDSAAKYADKAGKVPADCTTTKIYQKCTVCGEIARNTKATPVDHDHLILPTAADDATVAAANEAALKAIEKGLHCYDAADQVVTYMCPVCKVMVPKTTKKPEHTYVEYVVENASATINAAKYECVGIQTVTLCSVCGQQKGKAADKTVLTHKDSAWKEAYPDNEHSVGYWYATCENKILKMPDPAKAGKEEWKKEYTSCKHVKEQIGESPLPAPKNGYDEETATWYKNDEIDTVDELKEYNGSKFAVVGGKTADWNGLKLCSDNVWHFFVMGRWMTTYTGWSMYNNEFFYVTNGNLDVSKNGIMDYNGGKFIVSAGKIASSESGIRCVDGVNKFLVEKGQICDWVSGTKEIGGTTYIISKGLVVGTL